MYGTTTETTKQMLAATGFESTNEIVKAAAAARETNPQNSLILGQLYTAFLDLDTAETQLTNALEAIQERAASAAANLAKGLSFTGMWVAQSANHIAEYGPKMDAAIEKIKLLTWIYKGQTQG